MTTPIHKVGLVLLRGLRGDNAQVCLTQVKAKNPAEQHKVDFGLPKGTRQYRDPTDGQWKDARDAATAQRFHDALEPLNITLMNEAEQEIGLPRQALATASIHDLGERRFRSRKSPETYGIYWYVLEASMPLLAAMNPTPPDAYAVKWVRVADVPAMEKAGEINPCYAEVIEAAALMLRLNR